MSRRHDEVVRFVLNHLGRHLNPEIHIYAYLNLGGHGRFMGSIVRSTLHPEAVNPLDYEEMTANANRAYADGRVMSEVSLRPLGFVMSFDPKPPDARLVDISYFSHYPYDDWTQLQLKLPALPVWTMYPGDYRTLAQINRQAEQDKEDERTVNPARPLAHTNRHLE